MLSILVAAFFFASVQGKANFKDPHISIVGGEPADISDAPWQVAMLYGKSGTFLLTCGGSIIKDNAILSATHCQEKTTASQWKARAGSTLSASGGQRLDILSMVSHENYSPNGDDYDIALYITSGSFKLNGHTVATIYLPAQGQTIRDGASALITGWGTTIEDGPPSARLRKVTVPTVNQQTCARNYGGGLITSRMLCAGNLASGGQDACQGDSGGPLAINRVLMGVTSWGNGCAHPKYPGVYARVSEFIVWISKNVGKRRHLLTH